MHDAAPYQYPPGLKSPWSVSGVELNVKEQCVEVWAEHPEGASWACALCSRELPLYDHAEGRTWRHSDGWTNIATAFHKPETALGNRLCRSWVLFLIQGRSTKPRNPADVFYCRSQLSQMGANHLFSTSF
jgi:hypothetical protein